MDTLTALAEQLAGVISALKDMAKKAREAIASADAARESFQKKEAGLTDREVAVLEREKAVAVEAQKWTGFGDIVAAKDAVEAARVVVENDRRAFERDRSTRQAVIDEGEANVRIAVAALRKDRADLEKEKATYKQKILDDLKKKMG